MSEKKLVIIGAGPAGYTAAFLAADNGFDVILINQDSRIGGTCLCAGCIPTKTLLHAAKTLSLAKDAEAYGITFNDPTIDLVKLQLQKNTVIEKLAGGLKTLSKQKNIHFIEGSAAFADNKTLVIQKTNGEKEQLPFDKLIIATGSVPKKLPDMPESPLIMDATKALEIENIPPALLIIGGGYIGLEIGSIYSALGSDVTVVEMTKQLLPGTDADLVRMLQMNLKKTFWSIQLKARITGLREENNKLLVSLVNKKGEEENHEFDKALVAIGRKPNTTDLDLQNAGVECDEKGFIRVNVANATTNPNVFAVGDVTRGPMLAHKASHDARAVIDSLIGKESADVEKIIPSVIFTEPEIACCGLSEAQAKEENRNVKIVKFPWGASGRALSINQPLGFTKLIIEQSSEKILGMAIVGDGAGELITEGVLTIQNGLTAAQLKKCIHPHPTLSETLFESAEMFYGQSVHIKNP